jgi:hypothetical protein
MSWKPLQNAFQVPERITVETLARLPSSYATSPPFDRLGRVLNDFRIRYYDVLGAQQAMDTAAVAGGGLRPPSVQVGLTREPGGSAGFVTGREWMSRPPLRTHELAEGWSFDRRVMLPHVVPIVRSLRASV